MITWETPARGPGVAPMFQWLADQTSLGGIFIQVGVIFSIIFTVATITFHTINSITGAEK